MEMEMSHKNELYGIETAIKMVHNSHLHKVLFHYSIVFHTLYA